MLLEPESFGFPLSPSVATFSRALACPSIAFYLYDLLSGIFVCQCPKNCKIKTEFVYVLDFRGHPQGNRMKNFKII
jgi:hypothetical protein